MQLQLNSSIILQARAKNKSFYYLFFLFSRVCCLSYVDFLLFQRRHWTVKCLSGHPGVCVWVPAPGAVSATAHVTSSCGQPMLAPLALSWRNRLNVYHTAVWDCSNPQDTQAHILPIFNAGTLMISALDWEIVQHLFLILQRIYVLIAVKLRKFKYCCNTCADHQFCLLWGHFNSKRGA